MPAFVCSGAQDQLCRTWWLWCACVATCSVVHHRDLTVVACTLQLSFLTKGTDHLVQSVLRVYTDESARVANVCRASTTLMHGRKAHYKTVAITTRQWPSTAAPHSNSTVVHKTWCANSPGRPNRVVRTLTTIAVVAMLVVSSAVRTPWGGGSLPMALLITCTCTAQRSAQHGTAQ